MAGRPTWDNYFIGLAYHASLRSHDSQTQVGCVVVDSNKIVGMGYNGFCSNVNDNKLPTTRPEKYPYIVHAEQNAVSNMVIRPPFTKIYITHSPCAVCAKLLWQAGIREWVIPERALVNGHSEDDSLILAHLLDNGLKLKYIKPDLSYLTKIT
jgi:deoxycytidylate deaminase